MANEENFNNKQKEQCFFHWRLKIKYQMKLAVLEIRICRIRMFLGLPDLYPGPLVTSTDPSPDLDPAPDPSIIKQK